MDLLVSAIINFGDVLVGIFIVLAQAPKKLINTSSSRQVLFPLNKLFYMWVCHQYNKIYWSINAYKRTLHISCYKKNIFETCCRFSHKLPPQEKIKNVTLTSFAILSTQNVNVVTIFMVVVQLPHEHGTREFLLLLLFIVRSLHLTR